MKLCDITQFYAPRGGGVKRYLHEKIAYLQSHSSSDEHVLIVPGPRSGITHGLRSKIYTVASPLVSWRTGYRALLNLRAIDDILERERPDLIECADPYQLAWKTAAMARRQQIPAVAFYHSDFPEADLRGTAELFGEAFAAAVVKTGRRYAARVYNQFNATLVPSPVLASLLRASGIRNILPVDLGVNTGVFRPAPKDGRETRAALGIPEKTKLLLYVGRLAREKNTNALCRAFEIIAAGKPDAFHLLVVGDGHQRDKLQELRAATGAVTWLEFSSDAAELAKLYRAADLFVHPGMQETFGLVALESQACGTPIVGIRGSAMDRIILHDQESWARNNSPEALADAITQASARDLHRMGDTAARAVAEQYAWPRVFRRLFSIYQEVCSDYRGRGG